MTHNVVVVSGGFDPLHSGHINYLEAARKLGDILLVGINSDDWLARKKGRAFMPFEERRNIVEHLEMVDAAFGFDDSDGSATDAIQTALLHHTNSHIIFANGGDRTTDNIPEMSRVDDDAPVSFKFGVGGNDKANSSSWILNEWKSPKTDRPWGYYRKLHQDGPCTHVKELAVLPGEKLSMQRHKHRSELWMVTSGVATVATCSNPTPEFTVRHKLMPHETLDIQVGTWHQLSNETNDIVKIVEIQYGDRCMEEDIERYNVEEGYGASLYE